MNKTEKKEEKTLEIYILRQVNTLDKGFKLSYACKVFHCWWQAIPNFNNTVSKKVLSNIHSTLTYKHSRRSIGEWRRCLKNAVQCKYGGHIEHVC